VFKKENFPCVQITQEMIDKGHQLIPRTQVNRTIASSIDTLTGNIGEFVFAQWYYGDWNKNRVGENKGDVNFIDIEIKASSFPFNQNLNLLVRQDYAQKRKPPFYIQIIIDVEDSRAREIKQGTKAYICGYASSDDVDEAPLKDFGSKFGGSGGYKCHFINIMKLNSMENFSEAYKNRKKI
jgi:hypothetical protein